ncbi:MAG: hypothetical protein QM756_16295 [Polyangiaceae bacterium]
MTTIAKALASCALAASLGAVGCASQPVAPFDTLKTSNLTAFRLQNYEAPAAATTTPAATPGATGITIPGLPPEVQTWVQQGAQGLTALLPPGLLPPGLPGATAAAPAPVAEVPRFHGFRILGQTQVMDADLKEKLGKILGDEDSFDNKAARCAPGVLYAEMGLTWATGAPGQPSNDVLISFSCSQAVSRSFSWPHPATGMTADTVKSLTEVVQKLWPQGA